MSRATTEAWYNADRIGRLQVVAAYFVLNGLLPLGFALAIIVAVIRVGGRAPASDWVPAFLIMLARAAVSLYCAYLLWNARKAGAYWVIGLTALSATNWVTHPVHFLSELIFALIPVVLVLGSWSALKSDGPTFIRSRSSP